METSTVEAPASEQTNGAAAEPSVPLNAYGQPITEPAEQPPAPPPRACASCGAAMADGQDWCLQCGAGAPGALGTPSWRGVATLAGATVALLLGAGAAAYAALDSSPPKAKVVTRTVAQVSTPAPVTPATTPPPAIKTPGVKIPPIAAKPPKIPVVVATPKVSTTTTQPKSTTTTPSSTGGSTSEEPQGNAIVLDTNAASTYNPYTYPASNFGDPSLAIDGDTSTGWTAQIDPATAPKMAEGLLIDLKSAQKLGAVELVTSSPGMAVQLYGANTSAVPTSITDHALVALSSSVVVHKRHLQIKLRESTRAFRFVTLWISHAPASAVGTPARPGHVSVNELELFPAG